MKKAILFGIWLMSAVVGGIVSPAAALNSSVNIISGELHYSEISDALTKISKNLDKDDVTSEALRTDIDYIHEKRLRLESSKQGIESDIRSAEKRLEALGQAPASGNEVPLIAQKRKEFTTELAQARARLSEADLLLARMDELDVKIFNLRNRELWGNLLVSGEPLIRPTVFLSSCRQLLNFVLDIVKSPLPWFEKLTVDERATLKSNLIPVLLVIVFISFIGFILRRFIIRNFGYRTDIEHPRFGRKLLAAIAVWTAYGVIPALIIGSLLAWSVSGKILTLGLFGTVLKIFLYYSLYVIMAKAICRVVFTPYNERWRLINISTDRAKRVTMTLYISVFVVGVLAFLNKVAGLQNYPDELLVFLVGIQATVEAFCIVWVIHRLLWEDIPVPAEEEAAEVSEADEDETEDADSFVVKLTVFSLLAAVSILGLSLFGYPYLAAFITDRIIFSILLFLSFLGLRKIIQETLHRLLFLKFWFKTFRMRRRVLRRLDFWSSFLIEPLLSVIGFFLLLALWGVPADVLRNIVYRAFIGFTIGGIRISLLSIIMGIIVFFVAIAIVKALRHRLEDGLLARIEMEDGTRHSLAAGFSSIGYVASALLAVVIMGGNLTSLALVAGALSVGIGLGLQNVVNNFVSGIILLFERPVKVGDWVVINGEEGTVKQVNIRSTEVETFTRTSLIIPNANLLSTTITNLTHGNNWSRQKVAVSVAYGSDTEKVRDILLECAREHKKVLRKPEPYVLFKDFGASGLEFELRCYTGDIWSGWTIPSDLRFEINRRFNEEGIEIPFDQLVVHNADATVSASQETKSKKVKKDAD